jgi:hypothetical protein
MGCLTSYELCIKQFIILKCFIVHLIYFVVKLTIKKRVSWTEIFYKTFYVLL